ncbi:MAG: hypothetical protein IKP15_00330 [Bacteroidales bacterium]|nr:hypothetical protein [Bacteroidales bacterium]
MKHLQLLLCAALAVLSACAPADPMTVRTQSGLAALYAAERRMLHL